MSEAEPVRIMPDVVRAIHCRQIAEHGGVDGIHDEGCLPRLSIGRATCTPIVTRGAGADAAVPRVERRGIHSLLYLVYETMMRLASGEISDDAFAEWVRTGRNCFSGRARRSVSCEIVRMRYHPVKDLQARLDRPAMPFLG